MAKLNLPQLYSAEAKKRQELIFQEANTGTPLTTTGNVSFYSNTSGNTINTAGSSCDNGGQTCLLQLLDTALVNYTYNVDDYNSLETQVSANSGNIVTNTSDIDTNTDSINTLNTNKLSNIVEDITPELGGELDAGANSIGFTEIANTSTSGNATINWTNSNKQTITLTENTTLVFTNPSNPSNLLLRIKQDATGSRTLTLPTIKWSYGNTPTFTADANAIDIITLYYDGTDYYGNVGFDFQ